jgi:triphosphoribosyl-dephospho-CoA synthase
LVTVLPVLAEKRTLGKAGVVSHSLADAAVWALIEEANLTPKPGLVDASGPGVHHDMNNALLRRSALALKEVFFAIAYDSFGAQMNVALREHLSDLGRQGEAKMLGVTGNVNTHRGAIWTIGLLCAGAALRGGDSAGPQTVCRQAAALASLKDKRVSSSITHGEIIFARHGARGARGEAEDGFPHIVDAALPMLRRSRRAGATETQARLNALLAIMAELDDTCLLWRGGPAALEVARVGARRILELGGTATIRGREALSSLSNDLQHLGVSPGGSADLLAGGLFLEQIAHDTHSNGA